METRETKSFAESITPRGLRPGSGYMELLASMEEVRPDDPGVIEMRRQAEEDIALADAMEAAIEGIDDPAERQRISQAFVPEWMKGMKYTAITYSGNEAGWLRVLGVK